MLTKTIRISESNHIILSMMSSKNDTINDVISHLINYYLYFEEFSDDEADFYNSEIEKFENGILDDVEEVTLDELDKRLSFLENKILK